MLSRLIGDIRRNGGEAARPFGNIALACLFGADGRQILAETIHLRLGHGGVRISREDRGQDNENGRGAAHLRFFTDLHSDPPPFGGP